MNTKKLLAGTLALATLAGSAFAAPASTRMTGIPETPSMVVNVSSDCYAIGQQYAAQEGGVLASATAETRGGQAVCVIVIVKPSPDGGRRSRLEYVVPR